MAVHVIKKGLDLPIAGAPVQQIRSGPSVAKVAVLARDYPFMKPGMRVQVGDSVKRGQLLFEDRKTEGVRFTSPAAGTVSAINRGARRALRSVVIDLNLAERQHKPAESDHQPFSAFSGRDVRSLNRDDVRDLLVESGMWTAIRQRPYSKVPSPAGSCHSIFVTAIDTSPLAPDPAVVLEDQHDDFQRGLWAISHLTDGDVFLCRAPGARIEPGDAPRVRVEEFAGKHPAGLVGTHIHFLDPVHREKTVWHIGYQDVAAVGRLFETGKLSVRRFISLAGPMVIRPHLVSTRMGAIIETLLEDQLYFGETRVVSGSVVYGHSARGAAMGFLGRYSNQISCIGENRKRQFVGWALPGFDRFSTVRAYASCLRSRLYKYHFTTTTYGGHRAMVPIGMFERVMPLDIEPTFLLRALLVDDLERAEALGCLELDEEDLSLCSFVSPGKEDYAPALRRNLYEIWREG